MQSHFSQRELSMFVWPCVPLHTMTGADTCICSLVHKHTCSQCGLLVGFFFIPPPVTCNATTQQESDSWMSWDQGNCFCEISQRLPDGACTDVHGSQMTNLEDFAGPLTPSWSRHFGVLVKLCNPSNEISKQTFVSLRVNSRDAASSIWSLHCSKALSGCQSCFLSSATVCLLVLGLGTKSIEFSSFNQCFYLMYKMYFTYFDAAWSLLI